MHDLAKWFLNLAFWVSVGVILWVGFFVLVLVLVRMLRNDFFFSSTKHEQKNRSMKQIKVSEVRLDGVVRETVPQDPTAP